jgi:fructose-bisphosphate aldolase, class I
MQPMMTAMTPKVKEILGWYDGETPAVKTNIARMLLTGHLGGTGKMIILPVDQGFEHGPARSFAVNPDSYDPAYHIQMAVDAGLSAYAAPYGPLSIVADHFAGQIPTILKMNSANSLSRAKEAADQAVTASVEDAVRLGCSAIGFTIYPGSDAVYNQMEEFRDLAAAAKARGLATVLWSYPRGGNVSKDGETALDVVAYGAHMAALLGAHIIKVKLPTDFLEQKEAKEAYQKNGVKIGTLAERVNHIAQCCFNHRRLVVFSGGATKGMDGVLDDTRAIHTGGGHGSIIGRNCFQRPRAEAMQLLDTMTKIYLNKA